MTIILNRAPGPQPVQASHAPWVPVADRRWLEGADRSLRVLRGLVLILSACAVLGAFLGAGLSHGQSLIALPCAIVTVIASEVFIIVARSIVAAAWALRRPEDAPRGLD
jgi:hypothetical protein